MWFCEHDVIHFEHISMFRTCLVFCEHKNCGEVFFVQRAGFFPSVSAVLRNIGTVFAVSSRINTDSYGKKSWCGGKLFSWFPKSAPEKDKSSKKSCGEKKGGQTSFFTCMRRLSSRTHKLFWLVESGSNGFRSNGIMNSLSSVSFCDVFWLRRHIWLKTMTIQRF